MYALVDAVAFYASAEKVFDPAIRSKPVVVLTNNDGCICAVCPIARKLAIPKFQPYFQVKKILEDNQVVIRSSNYELYADLSERMMNVIGRFCDNQHIYSIDESFLNFTGFKKLIHDWHRYGHDIRRTVWRETKLPVGVGFGPTATLAKAANHAAKKLPGFDGVAVIDSEASRVAILKAMDVQDVWAFIAFPFRHLSSFSLSCISPSLFSLVLALLPSILFLFVLSPCRLSSPRPFSTALSFYAIISLIASPCHLLSLFICDFSSFFLHINIASPFAVSFFHFSLSRLFTLPVPFCDLC